MLELGALILPVLARVPDRSGTAILETRVRAAPSKAAKPVLRLPEGATVTVQGKPEKGWYHVKRGGLEGFVLTGDLATAPLAAGDAQPGESIDQPAVELTQRTGKKQHDRKDKKHDTPARDEIVVATALNLRAGPHKATRVIAVMPRGSRVTPTGEVRDGFVQLRWEGDIGWALGKHLSAQRPPAVRSDADPKTWSRKELIDIIYAAADKYGQPREDMLRVARCESDLVPTAVNASGGSYGLFQFKPGTWLGTPYGEYDIFDPRASANAAGWMWSVGRRREWVCQ